MRGHGIRLVSDLILPSAFLLILSFMMRTLSVGGVPSPALSAVPGWIPTGPRFRVGSALASPLRLLALAALTFLLAAGARADSVVVFNEIMYHPAADEAAMEWVELHNQNSVDVDLSGWRLSDAVDYVFPNGTVIKGGGYLVIASSPASLAAASGAANILGPFVGRLANNGEALTLRDLNNRIMDALVYGVDGEWPVAPDGSGLSLAKRQRNLASRGPDSWTVSAEIGGTPGVVNFSGALLLGPKGTVVPVTAGWRFEDSGTEPEPAWRTPSFDDRNWAAGSGLFFVEEASLPAPKNTPLAPDRSTYYFRGTFQVEGNPAEKVFMFRQVVDDGAVVYVNGTEVARFNMPTGAVSYATPALAAVGNASYTGPFTIPSSVLLPGANLVAVEVHQTTVTTNAGMRVNANGNLSFTVRWDGDDGDFSSPVSPALAPPNAALASQGAEVFTSSNTNLAGRLIDGRYGNDSAWSPAAGDLSPTVVLRFNQVIPISSIAWGRDNGDATEAGCTGGTCVDRTLGNYSFQYTLVTNPAVIVANATSPSNGWVTVATVQYLSAQPGFSPHLRHRFDFSGTNGPILATGVRFRPATSNTVDELEINPPAAAAFDTVFGLEISSQDILPPAPRIRFNEIGAASLTNTWIEIINTGEATVELGGLQAVRSGTVSPFYTFPPGLLGPGSLRAVLPAQLGFSTSEADRLFLYTAHRGAVLDAVTVRTNSRGRFPDGGDWMYPPAPTPGAPNQVPLRHDIVINEMMWHAPPLDPVPAVTTNRVLVPVNDIWRYHDAGTDLGSGWKAPGYDDSGWAAGTGPLAFNAGTLPAPVGTPLAAGRSTYYFRRSFSFSGATTNVTLDVRALVDDGAVFHLNGVEVFRQNMPAGPVSYATSALGPVGDASFGAPLVLPADRLLQGVNVLAVEVHQATSGAGSSGLLLSGGGLALAEAEPVVAE